MPYGLSYGLTYRDLLSMEHAFHVAARAGYRLNAFVTFMPARTVTAIARPRLFAKYRGHLGQALERGGYPFVANFVRERKADDVSEAGEHLHGLIHAPDETAFAIIARVHADAARIEWNSGSEGDFARLLYLGKQRAASCEGLVKKNCRPHVEWEKAAPIIGRRWSLTTGLRNLVSAASPTFTMPKNPKPKAPKLKRALTTETRRQAKAAQSQATTKPKPTFDVIEGGQLALFPTRTPSRLRDFAHGLMPPAVAREVEFHRARLGLTQSQLAARVGIGQPQLSNVLRGHDPMAAWVVTRLREALLGAGGPLVAFAA